MAKIKNWSFFYNLFPIDILKQLNRCMIFTVKPSNFVFKILQNSKGDFPWGFTLKQIFKNSSRSVSNENNYPKLNSFYRAKPDLKFALVVWGKDWWKEYDGWKEFLYLTNTVSFLSISFETADFEAGCICSF